MKWTFDQQSKERLDKFLHELYPSVSRNQIQKFIKDSGMKVNGKETTVHHWLKNGDSIEGMEPVATKKSPKAKTNESEPSILFQNDSFAIVIKPAGILIHPTERGETDTLAQWLVETFPSIKDVGEDPMRPGIIHRLDKDVGGLVLIALSQEAFIFFKEQFQTHQITKKYFCLVHGTISGDEGFIDTPIDRDKTKGRMVAQSGRVAGKEALTLYHVEKRFPHYSFIEVQIVTGRTHQIRAHLFSIGHGIVGDPLYQTRDIKSKKSHQLELRRPFLYAHYLSFDDTDGQHHEYNIPLPDDFNAILEKLK